MQELFGRVDLAPVPVRDKAHEILKRCIIEGKLAPGRRLIIILEASGNQTCRSLLRLLRARINHDRHLIIATPGRGRAAAKELVALLEPGCG